MAQKWYIDRDVKDLKVTLIGGITAGLVRSAMKSGHISRERIKKTNQREQTVGHCSIKYSLLCPEKCRLKGGTVVQEFGWDQESIKEHKSKFVNWASACNDEISSQSVQSYVQREYLGLDPVQDIPEVVEAVSAVTAHAIVAGHLQYGDLVPYFYHYLSHSWIWSLWQKSSGGLSLTTLREQCYRFAGMELVRPHRNGEVLILAGNGRVTFPQVCVDYSTVQQGLLELKIIAGHISYNSSTFTSVMEERAKYSVPTNDPERGTWWTANVIDANSQGINNNLRSDILKTSGISRRFLESSIKYAFANDGNRLLMRTNMCSAGYGQYEVNHGEAIEELAFAHHVQKAKVPIAESIIAMDLAEAGLTEIAVQPCSEVGVLSNGRHAPRFITTSPPNQETRFFAAHSQFMPMGVQELYVQQGASLAECIWETLKSGRTKGGNWKIITGHEF
ncbi:hypothetical protein MMC12_007649 [Toensbergia leucococca]|nr:hypothetical protein [Toensbergia leucococca]